MLQQPSAGPKAKVPSAWGDVEEVEGYRRTEMAPAERWIMLKTVNDAKLTVPWQLMPSEQGTN
jgi:hypothetical protein